MEDIMTSPAASSSVRPVLNRLFWRVHFWAGLITAPIVLFAACTGLLYVFTPQIEAWRHADVDHVPVGATVYPLDVQVSAVQAAFSDQTLRFVVPAHAPGETTQVYLRAPHAHHEAGMATARKAGEHDHGLPDGTIVYVDPYSARIVGHLQEMQRFKTWAKKLHSTALQGDGWRWLLELGASWMLVMFATGITMWWPRSQAAGGPGWRALAPRMGVGRQTWRDLHATVAMALGLVLAVVLVTGLTWTKHSGENFRAIQAALNQGTPKTPKTLRSAASPDAQALSWQAIFERALAGGPDVAVQITPPHGAEGVWRIENFDRGQPTRRFALVLDAYSGHPLFSSGWDGMPLLAQATAVGIPFHRGEFGVWNQVLLALAALAAIFSVVSGFVMWWQRRPSGKLAAPVLARRHLRGLPWWLWALSLGLAFALPVFGWSLLAFTLVESFRMAFSEATTAEIHA
jgi:uncharacterized iron-regulated membrane protein